MIESERQQYGCLRFSPYSHMNNTEVHNDEPDEFSLPWSLRVRLILLAIAPLVVIRFSSMELIDWTCAILTFLGFGALAILMIRYQGLSKLKHPFATFMVVGVAPALVLGIWLSVRVF